MLPPAFARFAEKSPISVMAGTLIERLLNPTRLDALFEAHAARQYRRTLLFSTLFDLMSQVVLGIQPSVHAAYQASLEEIAVSVTALYDKLNGLELSVSQALVNHSAEQAHLLIEALDGSLPALLPGFRVRILDGNCIEASEHRLKELRSLAAGPLPGKSLVVFDPALGVMTDVICCEDGHAQERSLFGQLLPKLEAGDLYLADRNFCTCGFLFAIAERQAYFIIRQHGNLAYEALEEPRFVGRTDAGLLWEQTVCIRDKTGAELVLRRICVELDEPTRSGENEVYVLTNLPQDKADAFTVARLYLERWTIEHAFQELTEHLESEVNTLGYPRAALFAFSVAVVSYNVLAVLKAALRSVHGQEAVAQLSGYYLATEIGATYRGMMIAIEAGKWAIFTEMAYSEVALVLQELAWKVKLSAYRKHARGKKKPVPKRKYDPSQPHVSTAKLLAQRKRAP